MFEDDLNPEYRPNPCKAYVDVVAVHTIDGQIVPAVIRTEEGFVYRIEAIREIKDRAPAYLAGGHGTRYTCLIAGEEHFLFHDRMLWFLELQHCLPYSERQMEGDAWHNVFEIGKSSSASRKKKSG